MHIMLTVRFERNISLQLLQKHDPDAINWIEKAFEILKAPFRASPIPQEVATRLETHHGVLQKATDGKMM